MSARALAASLGLRIVERRGGVAPYRCVISELHVRGKVIVLYRDSLELLERLVALRALPVDPAALAEIAVAHECFHFRSPHAAEADAHAFASDLLQLAASPSLLDDALARYLAGAA